MRTMISFVLLFGFTLFIIGCGGSQALQTASEGEVPDWFTTIPQDPNFLFAPNTATSQDLGLAIDKAITGARAEIGRQMEVRIQGLQKRFDEEVGLAEDAQLMQMFTQATKTVVSATLSGSRTKYQKQVKDGNLWRAYVLVEYPIGAANQALMQQIKNNNQMYTRFRSSEAFKELEEEVNKFEEWKKGQVQKNQ